MPQTISHNELICRGLAIGCQSLSTFLDLLRFHGTVFLISLERVVPLATGSDYHLSAIHITGRSLEPDYPICFCTFMVAEATSVGHHRWGKLLFPARGEATPSLLRQYRQHMQWCLTEVLEREPRVAAIRQGARYWLPDEMVWTLRTSLEGTGIVFQNGKWQSSLIASDLPTVRVPITRKLTPSGA